MKKILVFSDSHNATHNLRLILQRESDADAIIFLGDGADDLRVAEEELPRTPVYAVRGNCDMGSYLPLDGLVAFEGILIYYTHGHIYNVKCTLEDLAWAAKERGADIALFGHTHRPILKNLPDLVLFNPGSCGRTYTGMDTYGVILVEDGKIISAEHKFVPGAVEK